MNKRKIIVFLIISIAISFIIAKFSKTLSYEEQLIEIQSDELFSNFNEDISKESPEIKALLIDYSGENVLLYKALIAISRYGDMTREMLLLYGAEPEFQEILKIYGEGVIPPIYYFFTNDLRSLKAMQMANNGIQEVKNTVIAAWNSMTGSNESEQELKEEQLGQTVLGPQERGWYAVNFIDKEGYDFIGQFDVDSNNAVKWNQTERITEGVISFFTSGIRTLETKYDLGEEITATDALWAAADAAVFVSAFKLLRAGKAVAKTGKTVNFVKRTKVFAGSVLSSRKYIQKFGKYALYFGGVYVLIKHPGVINSVISEIANLIGLDPFVMQIIFWTLLITILLYPFFWIFMPLVKILYFIFYSFEKFIKHTQLANVSSTPGAT